MALHQMRAISRPFLVRAAVKLQMIIEKILKLINQFIISLTGRIISVCFIIIGLWFLYFINIIQKDYYYPDRYEDAFRLSGFLILGIIVAAIQLIYGFYINRRNSEHIMK